MECTVLLWLKNKGLGFQLRWVGWVFQVRILEFLTTLKSLKKAEKADTAAETTLKQLGN